MPATSQTHRRVVRGDGALASGRAFPVLVSLYLAGKDNRLLSWAQKITFFLMLEFLLTGQALAYEKAVEGPDVVLDKLFPKKGKVELDARAGMMLNTSYQQTFFVNGGINYFWSETWGLNLEGYMALASDKNERRCIETFYNDPNFNVAEECGENPPVETSPTGPGGQQDANWGPAYVPIRELKFMFVGNAVWNPIYGKQILLLSATNYFDFYLSAGGGLAMAQVQQKQKQLPDGRPARGDWNCTKKNRAAGLCPPGAESNPGTDDPNEIGVTGRPTPQASTTPLIKLAVGQRFHFFNRFQLTGALENFTLLGTQSGFDNFFTIMFGLGVRF